MHKITLICTTHVPCGNCNSKALYRIIESIQPEVIFEELSQATFDSYYIEEKLRTVETHAIQKYLLSHDIVHIPVDTYRGPRSDEDRIREMKEKLYSNPMIPECQNLRTAADHLISLKRQHGFTFLNSDLNDEQFERIKDLEKKMLETLNEEKLSNLYRLNWEVIEKREEEILKNIYQYSSEHNYDNAILFIGSGHRKTMMEKIKKYGLSGEPKLNWEIWTGEALLGK